MAACPGFTPMEPRDSLQKALLQPQPPFSEASSIVINPEYSSNIPDRQETEEKKVEEEEEEEEEEEAREEQEPREEKGSIALTSFNFINSIVGSGVIGMPFALRSAGLGVGLLILLLVALVADVALCLLISVAREVRVTTYQHLVRAAFGRPGFAITTCLQFLYPFISLISYNIIVGDTMTKVLIRVTGIGAESFLVRREFIVATSTFLITLPLSLCRNISRLAKISLVSVVIIVTIVIAMMVRLFTMRHTVPVTSGAWDFEGPNLGAAIGVMTFAFMCHHASFLVFQSLENNTQERWNKTTHISIGASAILSLGFATAGYVTFTGYAQGDIFDNYCWGDDLMNVCRGLFAITILLTYPIECFVARNVLENTFFTSSLCGQPPLPPSFLRHAVLAVLIALSCLFISLTTDCLGIVLELNGIVSAVPLAYILPAACYLRLAEGHLWRSRKKLLALGVGAFGIISFVMGIVSILGNIEVLSQCSHGKQLFYCFSKNNNTLQ